MTIKTITCHNVYNYGASLQAYALQTFLESHGHKVEVIDYRPKYKDVYRVVIPKNGKLGKLLKFCPVLAPVIILKRNKGLFHLIHKKRNFDNFTRKYLHLTEIRYRNYEELKHNPPIADLYIVGSDQVWNPEHQNGIDPAFYLMFGDKGIRRISYAASFGVSAINKEYQPFVSNSLTNINAISIREESGLQILKKYGYNSTPVIDPVFLLGQEFWNSLAGRQRIVTERYILLYDFKNNDPEVVKTTKRIAFEHKLKICAIYTNPGYTDMFYKNAGPIEFLNLIKYSSYVVSTSFHATAFSVIFNKDFYSFGQLGEGNSSRMSDFLNCIGLAKRFLTSSPNEICSINYEGVRIKLNDIIDKSKTWLLTNLHNVK